MSRFLLQRRLMFAVLLELSQALRVLYPETQDKNQSACHNDRRKGYAQADQLCQPADER